jgi:uncharacterized membrane protein YdjX (TVP38/TMEM64 family)
MKSIKSKLFLGCISIIIIILIFIMVKDLLPLFKEVLENIHDEKNVIGYIEAYGIKGVPILIALAFFQVISFIVPALPIQVLSGLCYGIWFGSLIYIIGAAIGNISIFLIIKKIKSILPFFKDATKKNKMQLINTKKITKPAIVVFALYLIPIIPNGIVPYVCSGLKIKLLNFSIAMILGLIPATLISAGLGHSISSSNHVLTMIIVAVLAIIILLIVIFKKKIIHLIEKY